MKSRWKSRKFWLTIVSAALIVANQAFGLDVPTDTVMAFAAVVIGWVLGESHVDAQRAKAAV